MKLLLVTLLATLSGCSLIQYSPFIACQHIVYERNGDTAQVLAEGCKI
jgi:hypothetical protein